MHGHAFWPQYDQLTTSSLVHVDDSHLKMDVSKVFEPGTDVRCSPSSMEVKHMQIYGKFKNLIAAIKLPVTPCKLSDIRFMDNPGKRSGVRI